MNELAPVHAYRLSRFTSAAQILELYTTHWPWPLARSLGSLPPVQLVIQLVS